MSNATEVMAPMRDVGPMRPGISLGRWFGVEVRLDWSIILIFALVAVNLGAGVFPFWHPDWSPAVVWLTAFAAAVLFFTSVLLHELSHALAARAQGTEVEGITLFLFGGVSFMRGEPRSAFAEFLIAVVGPVTSFAIGVVSTALGLFLARPVDGGFSSPDTARLMLGGAGPLATLLLWLGPVNVALAVFNLIPGFPLDGGRVLRSIFWGATKDFVKATRWAAFGGQLVAAVLIAFGVVNAIRGNLASGIWLVLIGWFLNSAARASWLSVAVRRSLADVPVTRVMRAPAGKVAPSMTVEALVRDLVMQTEQRAWPVENGDGRLVGLVAFDDVRRLPQEQWPTTQVAGIMTPREKLATLGVGQGADDALELMTRFDVDSLPVVEDERLVGVVRRSDLLKWYALQQTQRDLRPKTLRPLRH